MKIRFPVLAGILILANVGSSQTNLGQDQYFLFDKSSLVLSDRVSVSKGLYSHRSRDMHTGTDSNIRGQIIASMAKVIVGSRTSIDRPIYADKIHIEVKLRPWVGRRLGEGASKLPSSPLNRGRA